jgi:hypothetical protein
VELFYLQRPRESRPAFESGGPTKIGLLPPTGMGWVAPAASLYGPPICRNTPCPGHEVNNAKRVGLPVRAVTYPSQHRQARAGLGRVEAGCPDAVSEIGERRGQPEVKPYWSCMPDRVM